MRYHMSPSGHLGWLMVVVVSAVAVGVVAVGGMIRHEGDRVRRDAGRRAGASANGLDPETVAAARSIARQLIK